MKKEKGIPIHGSDSGLFTEKPERKEEYVNRDVFHQDTVRIRESFTNKFGYSRDYHVSDRRIDFSDGIGIWIGGIENDEYTMESVSKLIQNAYEIGLEHGEEIGIQKGRAKKKAGLVARVKAKFAAIVEELEENID